MFQSPISSSSLFHFTKSVDILISILKNGFYPRTATEDISFMLPEYDEFPVGIPMVCFTDIPIELTKSHREQYGMYGLGMKKEWGISKGINPIFYIIKDSAAYNAFNHMQYITVQNSKMLDEQLTKNKHSYKEEHSKSMEIMEAVFDFAGYIKIYCSSFEEDIKPFYDEREWRYLPPMRDEKQIRDETCNRLLPNQLNDDEKQKLNRYMEKTYSLKFDFNDVEQIIVPKGENNYDLIKKMLEESVINYNEYAKKIVEI